VGERENEVKGVSMKRGTQLRRDRHTETDTQRQTHTERQTGEHTFGEKWSTHSNMCASMIDSKESAPSGTCEKRNEWWKWCE
jgi:hypothetical protein